MKVNTIQMANFFIDLAQQDKIDVRQFGLMKRVYVTHGFSLAILERSALIRNMMLSRLGRIQQVARTV
jgi:uncharacterized phage-associated protein